MYMKLLYSVICQNFKVRFKKKTTPNKIFLSELTGEEFIAVKHTLLVEFQNLCYENLMSNAQILYWILNYFKVLKILELLIQLNEQVLVGERNSLICKTKKKMEDHILLANLCNCLVTISIMKILSLSRLPLLDSLNLQKAYTILRSLKLFKNLVQKV